MKNVLITGGTGLVGTDLLKQFVSENYKVYAVARKEASFNRDYLIWIKKDFEEIDSNFFRDLSNIDIIIHAGALINKDDSISDFNNFRVINMEFSEKLFYWCSNLKNYPTVIYISSLSFIQKPLSGIITESSPLAPISLYGISKYWGELALFGYSKSGAYRPVALRLSSPITFNMKLLHNTVVKKWIDNSLKKEKIHVYGKGTREQDFVSTLDITQAVFKIIQNENIQGVYNIASGSTISMTELADLISKKFSVEFDYTGKDINEKDKWLVSIEKAKKDFDYQPTYTSVKVIKKLLNTIV